MYEQKHQSHMQLNWHYIITNHCNIVLFQTKPEDEEIVEKVLKMSTILPKSLKCGEYTFGIPINPCQHPKFDENVHHVLAMLDTLYYTCGGLIFLTREDEEIVDTELVQLFGKRLLDMVETLKGLPGHLFSFIELTCKFDSQTSWGALIVPFTAKGHQTGTPARFRVELDGDIQSITRGNYPSTISSLNQISAENGSAAVSHQSDNQGIPRSSNPHTSPPEYVPEIEDSNTDSVPDVSSNQSEADADVHKSDDGDTNNMMDYSSYQKLDWTNNKKDWKKNVITKDVETQEILISCDMLQPAVPMTVTPKREHLQYMFQSDGDMERVLDTCQTDKVPQFAIACKSWWSIVSKHQTDSRPTRHVCDILTVSEDGRIHFWVIIADKDEENFLSAMEYLMTTGRMIKYQLIQHGAPQMYVQCSLFSLGETGQMLQEEESEKMQNYLHLFYYKDKFDFSTLQQALAKVILSRESPLTRCASEQNSIWLSAMQAMALMNRAKVNYISGAAGCRKSWIAAELYRLHGAKDSVYICTTGPFLEFLRFNGYRGTLIQCDNDLIKEISDGNFQNKTCIIIDDSHNFSCSRSCMEELFQLLKKKRDMALFVFADNDYQAFDRDRQQTMYDCVHDLTRQEHLGLNSTNLTDVYRNTRKVVSFIQSAVEDIADSHYRIQCTHIDDGDGVECIKIANVLADTPENGLVKYLQTLLQDYEPSAIAVFLDKSQQTIFQCRSLLAKQMANTTFQSADDFPRRGIIVDSVDSFLGLDAAVCIFILPSASREIEPEQTLANPRYRVFLASRATHKAVFVVPEIDADLVERMKFDQFYVSIS